MDYFKRHRRLVNSENGNPLIIDFGVPPVEPVSVKSKRAQSFSRLLLHTPICNVNTLPKKGQVKTFYVKEYHLDSKDSPYATLVQIGLNKFPCACTSAVNFLIKLSRSQPFSRMTEINARPGDNDSLNRSIVYISHNGAMLNYFAQLYRLQKSTRGLFTVLRDTKDQPRVFTLIYKLSEN